MRRDVAQQHAHCHKRRPLAVHEALEVGPEAMETIRLLVDVLQALRELDGRVSNQRDRNGEEGREEQRLRGPRPAAVRREDGEEEGARRAQVRLHDRPARRPPEGRGGPPRKGRLRRVISSCPSSFSTVDARRLPFCVRLGELPASRSSSLRMRSRRKVPSTPQTAFIPR